MRPVHVFAIIVSIIAALTLATTSTAAPPSGLTRHGKLIWQLDALLTDQFGPSPDVVRALARLQHVARLLRTRAAGTLRLLTA